MSWDRLIGVSDARVSVAEAAKIVGKSPETVRRAIRAGALEAERVGARGWWLVDPADVAALIVSSPMPRTFGDGRGRAWTRNLARDYRTIAELAREYRVSEQQVWRTCVDGRLPRSAGWRGLADSASGGAGGYREVVCSCGERGRRRSGRGPPGGVWLKDPRSFWRRPSPGRRPVFSITRPGVQVSFDEFLREVTTEACVMLALRAEKNLRKVRRAAGKLAENEELLAALAERLSLV